MTDLQPGWYPDPHDDSQRIYWTGVGWDMTGEEAVSEAEASLRPDSETSEDDTASSPSVAELEPRRFWIPLVSVLGAVVLIAVVAIAASSTSHSPAKSEDDSGEPDIPAVAAAPEVPSGFTAITNGVAWVWDDDPTEKLSACGGYKTIGCSVLKVQAIDGCSSIYAQANLLDASGTVIDYTNGTSGTISAGDTALIKMLQTTSGASKIRLTDVECH